MLIAQVEILGGDEDFYVKVDASLKKLKVRETKAEKMKTSKV